MPMPFLDRRFTLTDPDGATVEVRGTGNQFHADAISDPGPVMTFGARA
jgi:hypothetical protein